MTEVYLFFIYVNITLETCVCFHGNKTVIHYNAQDKAQRFRGALRNKDSYS